MIDTLINLLKDKLILVCLAIFVGLAYLLFKESIIDLCEQVEIYVIGVFIAVLVILDLGK